MMSPNIGNMDKILTAENLGNYAERTIGYVESEEIDTSFEGLNRVLAEKKDDINGDRDA